MPVDKDKATPRVRALAAVLKRHRQATGMSGRELSLRLGHSHSVVSHWENGLRVPTTDDVAALLTILGITGSERSRIMELARRAAEPNWLTVGIPGVSNQLAGVVECERAASEIAEWSTHLVPGLLQTADYSRALFAISGLEPGQIESRTMLRVGRGEILKRRQDPVRLLALVSAAALREEIGSPAVMAAQMADLLRLASMSNVWLHIVPENIGWHPGFSGPFVRYEFPETSPVMYFEHYRSGAFVSDSQDTQTYCTVIEQLRKIAFDDSASRAAIAEAATKWGRET